MYQYLDADIDDCDDNDGTVSSNNNNIGNDNNKNNDDIKGNDENTNGNDNNNNRDSNKRIQGKLKEFKKTTNCLQNNVDTVLGESEFLLAEMPAKYLACGAV